MIRNCATCLDGKELKPDGKKPPPGTVWCAKKAIPMGKNRLLPCYRPKPGMKSGRCMNCKWAKNNKPTGETPPVGHVWCSKRHIEIHKHRNMECFE